MNESRLGSMERDDWAIELEEKLPIGGVSFSEWATLMSYEAHTSFVSGADISTIILCTAACESSRDCEIRGDDVGVSVSGSRRCGAAVSVLCVNA